MALAQVFQAVQMVRHWVQMGSARALCSVMVSDGYMCSSGAGHHAINIAGKIQGHLHVLHTECHSSPQANVQCTSGYACIHDIRSLHVPHLIMFQVQWSHHLRTPPDCGYFVQVDILLRSQ